MARIRLSKQELSKQRRELALYRKTLPSLDLKRRQLTIALTEARKELRELQQRVAAIEGAIGSELPMIANSEIDLHGLVACDSVDIGHENVVGVRVPVVRSVSCHVTPYSLLAKPSWVDFLVDRLTEIVELRVRVHVAARRVEVLTRQERRTTQRVNLFERILIPQAERDIQRIRVYLGDQERASIARSKLAKKKQVALRRQAAMERGGAA